MKTHQAHPVKDRELISRYLNGNEYSLEILIQRYQNRIFSYIMMIVKDKDLANDLFQDTFVKVIKTLKSGSYNEEGKFLQWTMRIAHNLTIDHFRKAKRLATMNNRRYDDFDIFDVIASDAPSVEEKMVVEQIHRDVKKLIEYLPDEQKEVLKMRHYSEMSFKDIAEVSGVSINTALGRMRYALINLRKIIAEHDIVLSA